MAWMAWKEPYQAATAPKGTTINPPRDRQNGHKWQSQTMPKIKTTPKVRVNLGEDGEAHTGAKFSILDTAYKVPDGLERVNPH